MFDKDYVWKDKFNESDLSNQDWLEPDADIFQNIEEAIYSPEKKKRKLVFILIPFLFIVFLGVYFLFSGKANHAELLESNGNNQDNSSVLNSKQSSISSLSESIVAELDNSPVINSIENIDNKQKIKAEIIKTVNRKSSVNSSLAIESKATANLNHSPGSSFNSNFISNSTFKSNLKKQSLLKPLKLGNRITTEQFVIIPNLEPISEKGVLIQELITDHDKKELLASFVLNNQAITASDRRKNSLGFRVGLVQYGFNLNQNFTTAVQPAAFWHSQGKGFELGLDFNHHISNSFSLRYGISFGSFELKSGHNSTIEYILDEEIDGKNDISINMATPLGFIEGESTIVRSNQEAEDVSLNIALQNQHKLSYINLSTIGVFTTYSKQNFKVNLLAGVKLNRFVNVSNQLIDVDIDNSNFMSVQNNITSVTNLDNRIDVQLVTGLELEFGKLWSTFPIGLEYTFTKNVNPIFSQDNLNTNLSYHNVGFNLKF